MWCLIVSCFALKAQSTSPYNIFGHTSLVNYELNLKDLLCIKNDDTASMLKAVAFNVEHQTLFLLGKNDTVLEYQRLNPEDLLRFIPLDPLLQKYPATSPYSFVFNSPLIFVDPDGREGIVVSSQPGGHKQKDHFLINGLDRAKQAKKHLQRQDEKVTWIIYDDRSKEAGHDPKLLASYKAKAEKLGIQVMVVDDSDDIVDYINKKKGGKTREDDKITTFFYVGHAQLGDFSVGYHGTGDTFDPNDLKKKAFSGGAYVDLVAGCRTKIRDTFEKSVADQFAKILDEKSVILASDVRVFYKGGVVTDEQLLKANKGNIIKIHGKLKAKE